jgi:hypothetical protein
MALWIAAVLRVWPSPTAPAAVTETEAARTRQGADAAIEAASKLRRVGSTLSIIAPFRRRHPGCFLTGASAQTKESWSPQNRDVRRCAAIALAVLVMLVMGGILSAQPPAPVLDIRLSTETVPAGGTAQIKVYLGTPQPISSGSIVLTFTGLPTGAPALQGLTVFSATGDVTAVGIFDYADPYPEAIELSFFSPSAGVGRLPGVPILDFSIRVPNAFSVAVTGSFSGPAGTYAMTAQPGGGAIGGSLSIQTVTPATGFLPAGSQPTITGVGFQSGTDLEIDGVSLAAVDIASPAGSAPGSEAGLLQVNAQLPKDLVPSSVVAVVLTVGLEASQAAVTAAVK